MIQLVLGVFLISTVPSLLVKGNVVLAAFNAVIGVSNLYIYNKERKQ